MQIRETKAKVSNFIKLNDEYIDIMSITKAKYHFNNTENNTFIISDDEILIKDSYSNFHSYDHVHYFRSKTSSRKIRTNDVVDLKNAGEVTFYSETKTQVLLELTTTTGVISITIGHDNYNTYKMTEEEYLIQHTNITTDATEKILEIFKQKDDYMRSIR